MAGQNGTLATALHTQCQSGSEELDPEQGEASVFAVVSSLALNASVFIVLACVFGVLLSHQRLRFLLAPNVDRALSFKLLKPAGWLLDAWRSRRELYSSTDWRQFDASRSTDLDAAVIVRFCILGFKFSCCSTLVACFLLPLYASGKKQATGFDRYNLSNLTAQETEKFTLVVLAAYAQVLMFLHFAVAEWRRFLRLRDVHFNRLARGLGNPAHGSGQAQRSVIVELVPQAARSQDGRGVEEFFNRLFPGAGRGVHSCVLQADTKLCYKDPGAFLRSTGKDSIAHLHQGLRRMRETNVATILQRSLTCGPESSIGSCSGTPHGERTVARVQEMVDAALAECGSLKKTDEEEEPPRAFLGGSLAGAAEALHERARAASSTAAEEIRVLGGAVQDLTLGIREAVCKAEEEIKAFGDAVQDLTLGIDGTDTAFVTFWSVADRVVAEQLVLSHSGHWLVRAAPEARDVCWRNVPVSHALLKGRRLLARAGLVAGLIFWSVPVASIQLWTSLDAEPPDWAESGLGMFAFTVLRKNLPVLGLMALQYALPEVLRVLTKQFERRKAKSDIDTRVLGRNIKFQFATLWVTVISRTGVGLHRQFGCILQKPEFFFDVLRTEVPAVASFFLTFIATRVGLTLPVLLFRGLYSNFHMNKEMRPTNPDYPREATSLVLALVLGLTYSVLAPAIMPICAVFFGCAFLVYCWLFRHVYTPDHDCGGACWQHLFNASMSGLLFGTLTLAALSLNMLSSGYFYSLVVLAAIIVGSHVYMLRKFAYPSRYLSLEEACEVDKTSDSKVLESLREDYYVDPVLTEMSETHEAQGPGRGDEVEMPHEPNEPSKDFEEVVAQLPRKIASDRSSLQSKDWLQIDLERARASEKFQASFDTVACTAGKSRQTNASSRSKTSAGSRCPWIVCFPGQWRRLGCM